MTSRPVRRGARPFRDGLPLDAGTLLAAALIIGLLLRALVAGIMLPQSGFRIDIGDFTAWANRLASLGPGEFYETGYFSDYPPGYLYVLWLLGIVGSWLTPLVGQPATGGLVKIPGVLADIGVAWLLFVYCRRFLDHRFGLRGRSWSGEALGLTAAVVYLFNPVTTFNSAVWGQVDSVGTLVMLATLYALARGWTEGAALGAVVALLIKFQYGFLIPIVALVGLRRHLLGRSSDPAHDGRRDPVRILTSLAVGIGSLVVLLAPFGMTLWHPSGDPTLSLVHKFGEATKTYEGLTINAFNLWRTPWSGLGDTLQWGCDGPWQDSPGCANQGIAFMLGGTAIPWQTVSTVLFVAAVTLALWQIWRRDDATGLLVGTLLVAAAFFVLPTRVHERYLFPALALAAPLVARASLCTRPRAVLAAAVAVAVAVIGYVIPALQKGDAIGGGWAVVILFPILAAVAGWLLVRYGWAALYALLSLSVTANVVWVYTRDWSFAGGGVMNPGFGGGPMTLPGGIDDVLFSDAGVYAFSMLVVVAFAWLAWRTLRLGVSAAPAWTDAAAAITPRAAYAEPPPTTAGRDLPPAGELPPAGVPELRSRDPFLREPGRRLDRLDAVLLLCFVLFALLFRLWRIDVPQGYHFDEIYHARSAMEWLADWNEGWTEDTYEWTHPMLAKYLIAGGMVISDPNQVRATTALNAPSPGLAVAPPRASQSRQRSVAFTLDGGQIVARDALDGTEVSRWSADGPVSAIAYDDTAVRLLVGRSDAGEVVAYDLATFLTQTGPRAPPPTADRWSTGFSSVAQLDVSADGATILARGADGIARLDPDGTTLAATSELQSGGVAYLPGSGEDGDPYVLATVPGDANVVALNADTLEVADHEALVPELAGPVGPIMIQGNGDDRQVWILTGPLPAVAGVHPATGGGVAVWDNKLNKVGTAPLPGAGRVMAWQPVANLVYVAGVADGTGAAELWTVSPHGEWDASSARLRSGLAAWDTTALPGEPLAVAVDAVDTAPGDDNADVLVSTAPGTDGTAQLVSVETRGNAPAWRLSGIIFGSILVGLIYLLAATMFGRRRIAIMAAAFVAIDGMSYVMSRIAMNDIFVATFIVAAYLLFWQIWSGRWARSAWWALPLVGVLIGLAASTKWVGFYALAGLLVLVFTRSPLGRLLLAAGMGLVLVAAGSGAPWPFVITCGVIVGVALVILWRWPVRISFDDLLALPASGLVLGGIGMAFAVAYNGVEGRAPTDAVEMVFAFFLRGAQAAWPAWVMLGVAGVLIAARAFRSLRAPASDARWWAPAEMGGFSWPWIAACLVIVPLTVYFLSYIPYLALGHGITTEHLGPGYAWSLDELHAQMFGYHFGLQAGHPSSSPWWSWPLDLKPTWFYGHGYDDRSYAAIYNHGNQVLVWAGIPALVFAAIMAWRRRSLALVLIVLAFGFQFFPWTRIERASFMYHYLTALVFAMVAVAYAVDELLERWEWRPFGIAFLAAVGAAFLLTWPLNSALAMPDWYINAARALPPWNYGFVFPDPPKGTRADLLGADTFKLAVGVAASLGIVAFALVGRSLMGSFLAAAGDRRDDDEQPGDDQTDGPDPSPVEVDVLADEGPRPDRDEDPADDEGPLA